MTKNDVVIFDLDDTLYKEETFLISAYREISSLIVSNFHCSTFPKEVFDFMLGKYRKGENAFNETIKHYGLSVKIEVLISLYRNHVPTENGKSTIHLVNGAEDCLKSLRTCGCHLGLLTDGRVVSQMNKIRALGLLDYFTCENILISEAFGSEKPDVRNFEFFMHKYPENTYMYVGDDLNKDFVAPNKLGWNSVCIEDSIGVNIHKQRDIRLIDASKKPSVFSRFEDWRNW